MIGLVAGVAGVTWSRDGRLLGVVPLDKSIVILDAP